jgi:predicted phosphoribosyltransferase
MYHDRKHAAHHLAEKLIKYKGQDQRVVVAAIPRGGVRVGSNLALALGFPIEITPPKGMLTKTKQLLAISPHNDSVS